MVLLRWMAAAVMFCAALAVPDLLMASPGTGTVVAVTGDSIARGPAPYGRDGFPARLRNRVCGAYCGPTTSVVVDHTAGAMCLVSTGCSGGTLVNLWDTVLATDPTTVVVLVGVNDLFQPAITVNQLADGFRSLSDRAVAAGIHVRYCTLAPVAAGYPHRALVEPRRAQINTWLRSYFGAANVIDMDALLRVPWGTHLDPHYDIGDGLHPNALGTVYMADAVAMTQLD
jgi:hypothetical protein